MIAFLKTCLKGLIVIITAPLWAAVFVIAAAYALILFFYTAIKSLIRIFTKQSGGIYGTSYDQKAKEILSSPNFNPTTGTMAAFPPQQPQFQQQYPQGQYFPPTGAYPQPYYDPRQNQNEEGK